MVNRSDVQAPPVFDNVPACPPDPIFELTMVYQRDNNTNKINLGAGAYRDNNGQPWVLPCVRAAKLNIANDADDLHEYPPIAGRPMFRALAAKCIFGADSQALAEARVASNQTISGTGANHLAGLFLRKFRPNANLYLSSPTWGNHLALYESVGFHKAQDYPYWDEASRSLNIEGMLNCMETAPNGSIFLLHACAHNPTGVDPTREQWLDIVEVMQRKEHIPLFDSAYQGFASGNLDQDAYAVRLFVERGLEMLVCQSFSKNLGIYGERTGCLHIVTKSSVAASCIASQLADLTRSEISCTPCYGAKIAEQVLSNEALYKQWRDSDLPTMAGRIIEMRKALFKHLLALETPGNWEHVVGQIGMFSYTGLTPNQCQALIGQYSIYLASNGRISLSGLNHSNVEYFARAVDQVVRNIK